MENKAAHRALYDTIAAESENYDAFLKMDADMVFRDNDCLVKMVTELKSDMETDVMIWPVLDFFSNSNIYGISMFSGRVRWPADIPDVFVDPPPVFPGRQVSHPRDVWVPVAHAPLSCARQAFEFGVHRGLKAFAADTGRGILPGASLFQIRILIRVWKAFRASGDQTRALAILGAEYVRRGRVGTFCYKNNQQLDLLFTEARQLSKREVVAMCRPFWSWRAPFLFGLGWVRDRVLARF